MSDHENNPTQNPGDAGIFNGNTEKMNSRFQKHRKHDRICEEWGWWEDRTLPQKILLGIGFAILGVGLLFLFGWIVMLLWNWLMPDIFGLKRITYWQAWGLLALCTILFKGFGSSNSHSRSDRKRRRELRRYIREDQPVEQDIRESER